jgi:hypothetical protein
MVDFGSQSDAEHQDGWGAMLDVVKPILRSDVSGGSQRVTADQFGVLQVFSVWEDDPASFDREYVEDKNGVLKPTVGPVLYGNGYSWYRGAGGAGVGFPFCSMTGPSTVREEMWLDNVRFYSQYVRFTPIEKGVHIMDQRIGVAEGGSGISVVGGNRDCATTNGPYAAQGVYGGVRIGEVMAFRHYLPVRQRTQIRNALGVKWFGTEKYSHGYGFEDVIISQGASLSLPYAEVSVTNLTIAGDFSSRSISVSTALRQAANLLKICGWNTATSVGSAAQFRTTSVLTLTIPKAAEAPSPATATVLKSTAVATATPFPTAISTRFTTQALPIR